MLKVVVSSCLLGSPVRYNAEHKKSSHPVLERWIDEGRVVSACPEMLGGLGTPRPPAEIVDDGTRRVFTREGRNVTREFNEGARLTSEIASTSDVRIAVLKSFSPSCGTSQIYDGTFSKVVVPGDGIATARLRAQGIAVFTEDEFDAADEYLKSLEEK